jgi:hypothetical protein
MAYKEVMNGDGVIGHKLTPPSVVTGGIFVITSVPWAKGLAPSVGPGTHLDALTYEFSGGSAPGFIAGTVETAVEQEIPATATTVFFDEKAVMRKGDFAVMGCIGEIDPPPTPPLPPTGPVPGATVEVLNAGQIKFLAQ